MELSDKDIKNAHLHMFEKGKHENDERKKRLITSQLNF